MELNNNIKLTFDESAKIEVLGFLNKDIDSENYIIEKDNPSQRVLTIDGEEVQISEFGGAKAGSEVFIKKDIVALMRLSKI